MTVVDVCTIVSRRELARARVLAATLHEHQPEVAFTVLLLDGDPGDVGEVEYARMLSLDDVLAEGGGLMVAANPPGALAAAVLPRLLRLLLDEGGGPVIYLAAGQRVLGSLKELWDVLGTHSFVLVARAQIPRSGIRGAFSGERGGGAFSERMLGVSASNASGRLLQAWPRWFADEGDDGASAIRDWFDRLAAIGEDVGVLRDPGYGLDPVTLRARSLGQHRDALEVDGRAARRFDFGAQDPVRPTAFCEGDDGVRLSSAPALADLCARHAEELLAAGSAQDAQRQERYGALSDGARLTPAIRRLLIEAIDGGRLTESPFTDSGRAQLYSYLNEPGPRGRSIGLTRLHLEIWDRSRELQSAYPHIDGPDGSGFAGWLCRYGYEQEGLVPALLPPAPELAFRDSDPMVHEQEQRWGVNVAGFFTAELGVGEAARLLIAGLDAQGIPALPIQGQLIPPSRQGVQFSYAHPDDAAYPVNIVCINGDGIPPFAREAGRSFFEGRHTIALWWWEVGDPPAEWGGAYEFVDEVWVASRHIYDAIAPTSPVPVVKMTLPVLMPEVAQRTRGELGLPEDGFVLLYVHDYHSVSARKNPLGAIEAFRRAFPAGSGAKLVVKSINAETRPVEHDRVVLAASEHPDVTLLDEYVSQAEKNAMIAHCDCYVSLHRSEGFGLTVAEAMLLSKPVIATRYGGTQEFLTDENAYPVDWVPVPVGEGAFPYPPDGVWAEPDLDQAAGLMRRVHSERDEARERGATARRQMLERHSPQVAGAAMRRRLALIHERMYQEGARSLNLAYLPTSLDGELVPDRIASAPKITWGRSNLLAYLKRRLQRPVADWAQAYAEHQRSIESEMHSEIARIDARLREVARTLREQQQAHHAETLAVLRRFEDGSSGARNHGSSGKERTG
jgi:glycosyltransferase involved in cell wall biosynthesis